jgi:hypothetical protein
MSSQKPSIVEVAISISKSHYSEDAQAYLTIIVFGSIIASEIKITNISSHLSLPLSFLRSIRYLLMFFIFQQGVTMSYSYFPSFR